MPSSAGSPSDSIMTWRLATDRFGSDLWAHREFFVSGCRVGAPPDGFSPKGQDWGFPPPTSERHDEDGYRLFAESIRKNCRHGGALRIDHVMRFFRLYWIPDGMEATDGTYVRDRYQALLSILALESVRNQVLVDRRGLGHGARSGARGLASIWSPELSLAVFRARQRPVPRAAGIPARRIGVGHHARSADAGGFLAGTRH